MPTNISTPVTTTFQPQFTASGLISGLDTGSMVTQLTALASAPITQLQAQESAIKSQISAERSAYTNAQAQLERSRSEINGERSQEPLTHLAVLVPLRRIHRANLHTWP